MGAGAITPGLTAKTAALEPFCESVRERAAGIDNAEGRQAVMLELYGSFFKRVAPDTGRDAGIVYTPTDYPVYAIPQASRRSRPTFELTQRLLAQATARLTVPLMAGRSNSGAPEGRPLG